MATAGNSESDVVVIGGGPAGSTVSTLLAQQGLKVALFERERFPRFHIGESLIPETYWVLKRLNMLHKMQESHFVKKYSVQFVNASGKLSAPFYFWDNKPHECSQTWQVVRSEFDQMMLDNAREHGVEVHEGVARARTCCSRATGPSACASRARTARQREVRAQGRRRRQRPERDCCRTASSCASGTRCSTRAPSGPTGKAPTATPAATRARRSSSRRRTSRAGSGTSRCTTTSSASASSRRSTTCSRAAAATSRPTTRKSKRCPAVKERVAKAKRVTGYFATKDYSYRSKQVAGDGWVLVGDAFGFLDPLYSSGVLLALQVGRAGRRRDRRGPGKSGDVSAAQLGKWGAAFNQGVDRMRRLVCEYYDGFSFGKFVRKFPHLKGTVTDLLIGDLFTDRVDEVWEPMESLYPPDKKPIPSWNAAAPETGGEQGQRAVPAQRTQAVSRSNWKTSHLTLRVIGS